MNRSRRQRARAIWVLTAQVVALLGVVPAAAHAQAETAHLHAGHETVQMADPSVVGGDGAAMPMPMDMASMQGGRAPPDARDPFAYSYGVPFTRGSSRLRLADEMRVRYLLIDNFEVLRTDGDTSVAYDLEGWIGQTFNRAVLKAEGNIQSGKISAERTEILWGHALASFWDAQLGVRRDGGSGPDRNWLAFGIDGLAPYWFEVEITGYIGEASRTAVRIDASYEMRLTQRLVLQPRLEANFYGKNDLERSLGSGLSDLAVAFRLRYAFRREFASYVGVEWMNQYGRTEELTRAAGGDPRDTRVIAGLRFWF